MGTRAQFFIGNPQDLDRREWLGTVAFDGYPDGDGSILAGATNEEGFRALVGTLAASRRDFCDPAKHGFPFPWVRDLFLTDYTYAFFDGRVQMTRFHLGWIDLAAFLESGEEGARAYHEGEEKLPSNVPAPTDVWDSTGPDSIMIIRAPG